MKMGLISTDIKKNQLIPWARLNYNAISDRAKGPQIYPTIYMFKCFISLGFRKFNT